MVTILQTLSVLLQFTQWPTDAQGAFPFKRMTFGGVAASRTLLRAVGISVVILFIPTI
ncbi:hypothetical protein SDC9_159177 [bioreactor metagenome]|uniref:Uncharacterized protein n=1 Tax=bioreactor metagenome TaxID=1076179 RepID=A0A645FEU5_9ZZZZ